MPKFGFSDGYKCYANTSEEAKIKHKDYLKNKVVADTFENNKENAFRTLDKIESCFIHIKDEVDKSLRALDVVDKESFKKSIVKNYIAEIDNYVDETEWKDLIKEMFGLLHSLTRDSNSWQEWKEKCLSMLPDCSVAEQQKAEQLLEELCH